MAPRAGFELDRNLLTALLARSGLRRQYPLPYPREMFAALIAPSTRRSLTLRP